ncbi:MAG: hypothetical protein C0501_04850 [Isosphaera sp.]|nr:hypothetical protein [Isosphaera sp.]
MTRRAARAVAAWVVAGYLAATVAAALVIEVVRPELRDEEYGRRLDGLLARVKENPGRPLVVVVGSSRAAMAICPRAWEEVRPGTPTDPLVFNLSRVGGGPLMNLLTLRRLYADGVRPAAVLLEYWPPLLRQDGPFREADRIDADKLYLADRPFVRDYLPDPDRVERRMLESRLNPVSEHRTLLLRRLVPGWLPRATRIDPAVDPLDGWGWLPGLDRPALALQSRDTRLSHHEGTYRAQLRGLRVDPDADHAIREAVALARGHGAAVGFVWLPESTEFRGWYPPEAERLGQAYLALLRDGLRVPLIDARTWLDDEDLADGFHATRQGAEVFTRPLGPAAAEFLAR